MGGGSPKAARPEASKGGRRLVLAKGVRFSCRRCGDCCREFPVALTPAEAERYEARDWTDVLGAPAHVVTTHRIGGEVTRLLARKRDGSCVFLDDDSACRMHAALGEAEKPLTCRVFPFAFVAADLGGARPGRPVVGAQFSCSSVAAGDGAPAASSRRALEPLLSELEAAQPLVADPAALPFLGKIAYPRVEVELLLELTTAEFEDASQPFPQRILAVSKFLSLVAGSRLPSLDSGSARKAVTSFARGVRDQVQRDLLRGPLGPAALPQRLLFRMLLAFAARRDPASLLEAGVLRRSVRRMGNLLAGMSFMAGSGLLLPVGAGKRVALGEVRRRAPSADPADPDADGALTRYFLAQLTGRALLRPGFQVPHVLPALGLLLRQYPMILLFARAACLARGGERVTREDYASALRTADWNFGRLPWTAGVLGGMRGRLLADVEASLALVDWCARRPGAADPRASAASPGGTPGGTP